MRLFLAVIALVVFSAPVFAGECFDASGPRKWVAERHGSWAKMSPDQWQFLRGVSAMNPKTPPGLPFGEAAVLVTFPGQDDAEIFFLDGDQACTPMPIPKVLVDMLSTVGDGTIRHEGQRM